jgi:hypothetical protein
MGLGLEIIDAMKIYHPTISLLTALATGCATSSPTKLTTIQNDSVPPLERRLLELGYNEQQINEQLSTLSEDELEYFNKHPEEIKKSGIIILAGLIWSSVYSSNQKKKQKQLEEEVQELKMKEEVKDQLQKELSTPQTNQ